ncbi:phage major capsid protein [Chelativorans intermedius]|uniref:Phage major capsid protein n=1 Tax=Chelativorans intermedius TaxID=515947 RepID=A0ABV6DC40_9HYPH|nr:phage major capsid protein [Chelativorans intermedius]MCT8999631.1 phage major capsid protein [Chelativorans intermedius]
MQLQALKEQRAAKIAEMRAINEKASNDNRDLDEGERKQFDALEKEVRGLGDQIDRAEKLATYERLEAAGEHIGGNGEMRRELRNYSLAKASTEALAGKLSGLEAEVHQELSKGRETRGLMVPTEILLGGAETRALTTTTPVAGPGGNLIRTDLASMTDRRRPALKVESLGATVLRGLIGNLDLPRLAESGTAHWIAEHSDTTRSDAQFSKKSMGPKTVSGEYELSRRMLLQSQEAIETILRRDLGFILAQALDLASIKGGGANEPTGIMADADVTELTAAALDTAATADMIAALEIDDVTGTRAFLTHPAVMAIARKREDNDGLPIPIATTFHNERVESTTQVPVVTAGPPETRALIYGEWASLYLGYWSGVDILMNPYHADVASKGGVLLHAFLDTDVVVRHPEAFRWMEITG